MIDENLPKLQTSDFRVRRGTFHNEMTVREDRALVPTRRAGSSQARRRWSTGRFTGRAGRSSSRGSVPESRPWMRGTMIKCGAATLILLSVIALKSLDWPFAVKATDYVRAAVTTDLDVGKTLGKLEFVRNIMPEAAQVFWEFPDPQAEEWLEPCDGQVVATYSEANPGVEIRGGTGTIFAAASGTVIEVTQESTGETGIRISHEDGRESYYGGLSESYVTQSQPVGIGEAIGFASARDGEYRLYFEVTQHSRTIDPATVVTFAPAEAAAPVDPDAQGEDAP